MKRLAVESTTLLTIAYDVDRQILQLEFRDRSVYNYFNIPADVHQCLVDAPSIGGYFNNCIRGRFEYARVESISLS